MMHDEIVLTDPMMPAAAEGKDAALERARGQYEPFPDGVVTLLGDPFVALDLFFDATSVARQLLAAPRAGGAVESAIAFGQRLRVRAQRLFPRRIAARRP
ncbi:MAG: hypothetical protein ACNA8R_11275 [Nitriliruptoraceae bacterium]